MIGSHQGRFNMDIITDGRRLWRLIALFTTTMICSVAQGFYGQDYDDRQNYDELPIENITYNIYLNQIEIETYLLIEPESWIDAELQFDENSVIPVTDNRKIIIPEDIFYRLEESAQDAYITVSYTEFSSNSSIRQNEWHKPKKKKFKIKNAVKALKDRMLKELGVALEHYDTEIENLDDYTKPHKRRKLFLFHFAVGEAMVLSDIVVSQGIANHVLNIIAMKAATTGKIDTTLSEAFALLKIIANPHHLVTEISETMMNICPESTVLTLTSCIKLDDFLADDITKKLESFFKKAADVLHQNVILESNTKDPNHPSYGLAGATVSIEKTPAMRVIHFFAGKYNGTSITLPKGLVSSSTEYVYKYYEANYFTKTESECGDWCIYTKKDDNQIEDAVIYDAFYRLKDPYIVINQHVTCTERRRLMQGNEEHKVDCTEDNPRTGNRVGPPTGGEIGVKIRDNNETHEETDNDENDRDSILGLSNIKASNEENDDKVNSSLLDVFNEENDDEELNVNAEITSNTDHEIGGQHFIGYENKENSDYENKKNSDDDEEKSKDKEDLGQAVTIINHDSPNTKKDKETFMDKGCKFLNTCCKCFTKKAKNQDTEGQDPELSEICNPPSHYTDFCFCDRCRQYRESQKAKNNYVPKTVHHQNMIPICDGNSGTIVAYRDTEERRYTRTTQYNLYCLDDDQKKNMYDNNNYYTIDEEEHYSEQNNNSRRVPVVDGDTIIVENLNSFKIRKNNGSEESQHQSIPHDVITSGTQYFIELNFPNRFGLVDLAVDANRLVSELEINKRYTVRKVRSTHYTTSFRIIPKID